MTVRRPANMGFQAKATGGNVSRTGVVTLLAGVMLLFLFAGCGPKKEVAADPFFEQWSALAQESEGTSPVARERVHEIPGDPSETAMSRTEILKEAEKKELPKNRVTLKMRNADVPTVLRALARAADQNILMKTEISGTVSVDFDQVPWDEAFVSILRSRALSYLWEGDIIRVATFECLENDLRWQSIKEKRMEQEVLRSRLAPLHTMVIPVDYADADSLRVNLTEFLTKKENGEPYGSIRVNQHTNSLVAQATRADLERIVPLIDRMDQPTAQVHIAANIVEATSDTARDLGIMWGGMRRGSWGGENVWFSGGGTGGAVQADPVGGGYTPAVGGKGLSGHGMGVDFPVTGALQAAGAGGSFGLMMGHIGGNILEVQLQALQQEGRLNILSRPSITTLDNQMAFTENGRRIPFVTLDSDGDQTVEWEDAVLRLEITPHVIDDDTLKMKIVIKKDELDRTVDVRGNPGIIKKQTDTTLIVNDGETIVISGLSKKQEQLQDAGIPWLSEMPGLGWLFKSEGRSQVMEEVLIFITPRILPPMGPKVRN